MTFLEYLLDVYGENGCYADTFEEHFGEPMTEEQAKWAIEKMKELDGGPLAPNSDKEFEFLNGVDTLDRERARDLLLYYKAGVRNTEHIMPGMDEHIKRPLFDVDTNDDIEELEDRSTEYMETFIEIYYENKEAMAMEGAYIEPMEEILEDRKSS